MREIKFRGRRSGNDFVFGSLITYNGEAVIKPYGPDGMRIIVDPDTVGQFTGLRDGSKWDSLSEYEQAHWLAQDGTPESWKGREIYEGDVLRFANGQISAVQYGEYNYYRFAGDDDADEGTEHGWYCLDQYGKYGEPLMGLADSAKHSEVIGNVHENPELLK